MAWAKDKLHLLEQHTDDEFIARNLRAISRALDIRSNPRLKAIIERSEYGTQRTTSNADGGAQSAR